MLTTITLTPLQPSLGMKRRTKTHTPMPSTKVARASTRKRQLRKCAAEVEMEAINARRGSVASTTSSKGHERFGSTASLAMSRAMRSRRGSAASTVTSATSMASVASSLLGVSRSTTKLKTAARTARVDRLERELKQARNKLDKMERVAAHLREVAASKDAEINELRKEARRVNREHEEELTFLRGEMESRVLELEHRLMAKESKFQLGLSELDMLRDTERENSKLRQQLLKQQAINDQADIDRARWQKQLSWAKLEYEAKLGRMFGTMIETVRLDMEKKAVAHLDRQVQCVLKDNETLRDQLAKRTQQLASSQNEWKRLHAEWQQLKAERDTLSSLHEAQVIRQQRAAAVREQVRKEDPQGRLIDRLLHNLDASVQHVKRIEDENDELKQSLREMFSLLGKKDGMLRQAQARAASACKRAMSAPARRPCRLHSLGAAELDDRRSDVCQDQRADDANAHGDGDGDASGDTGKGINLDDLAWSMLAIWNRSASASSRRRKQSGIRPESHQQLLAAGSVAVPEAYARSRPLTAPQQQHRPPRFL